MATPSVRPCRAARRSAAILAGTVLLLSAPAAVQAQDGFLFRAPIGTLTLRAGPMVHTVSGDLFGQLRRDLTLQRRDFAATAIGLEVALAPLERWDLVLGLGHARAASGSEFRDFVDQDELPIVQSTQLVTTPMTATVRYQLASRGRSIGRTAWVPTTTTPYLGAGGGLLMYRLEHSGEFIDFRDYAIFFDHMEAKGTAYLAHALAGVDHWLTPRLGVNAEARYTWSRANPEQAFRSFDTLDLGGVQATVGLSLRF